MLGVILTYHSFHEFYPYQLANLKKHIKVPFKIYFIDNSFVHHSMPDCVYLECKVSGSPSHRHQEAINMGLCYAWNDCDAFLIFDNDMIFLEDWTPPSVCQYLPQRRGNLEYAWLNLLYFPKDEALKRFDFANCTQTRERTDSGGSFGFFLRNGGKAETIATLENRKEYFPQFIDGYEALCRKHKVGIWYDVFCMNGTKVFHFRALSNWTNYPEVFQQEKKKLILYSV